MTKRKQATTWVWPRTWQQYLAWATTLGAVILAVTPLLPESTPEWVRVTLGIAAVIIAKLAQSDRKLEPTTSEAVQALTSPEARASMPPAGPQ